MNISIFETVSGFSDSRELLSGESGIVRFYPFGYVDINAHNKEETPYATWQIIGGSPVNSLACRPNLDNYQIQIDVWAETATECFQAVESIRDAIEVKAYVTSWVSTGRDEETALYRYTITTSWWERRTGKTNNTGRENQEIESLLGIASVMEPDNWTESSWSHFQNKMDEAESLSGSATPDPSEIENIREDLFDAITNLEYAGGQNYEKPPFDSNIYLQLAGFPTFPLRNPVQEADGFDTPKSTFQGINERGLYPIAYFSAGTYEDWRLDAPLFPESVKLKKMEEWEGEWWLDVRKINEIGPLMQARAHYAKDKGAKAIDWDNIDVFSNTAGVQAGITKQDQHEFNKMLAEVCHEIGLAVIHKNIALAEQDEPYFDGCVCEQPYQFNEVDGLEPFYSNNKPCWVIEYQQSALDCADADQRNIYAALYPPLLDGPPIHVCGGGIPDPPRDVFETVAGKDAVTAEQGWLYNQSGEPLTFMEPGQNMYSVMRFRNVSISDPGNIYKVYIECVTKWYGSYPPQDDMTSADYVNIGAEEVDDSPPISEAGDLISRAMQVDKVKWEGSEMGVDDNSVIRSPDLTAQLQSVIQRQGWQDGNDISFFIVGQDNVTQNVAVKNQFVGANEEDWPRLVVEYYD